jgi:hypothetical protein
VSDPLWTHLRAPFAADAVTWDPTTTNDAGDEVLLVPRLSRAALVARLDEVVGAPGWSLLLMPTDGGMVATLRIGEVAKSAAADRVTIQEPSAERAADVVTTRGPAVERTADVAFARAAALLGLVAPALEPRWAGYDAETGVVLDESVDTPDATAVPPAAPADEAPPVPDVMRTAAAARGLTPEGLQMIDRLVERLKDEGQGLAAARLLVKHGGYGNDPAAARELYAQLRALLVRAGEPRP